MDIYVLFKQPLFYVATQIPFCTAVGTFSCLVVNIPAGYAFGPEKKFIGRKWMSILYIIPMFVSGV